MAFPDSFSPLDLLGLPYIANPANRPTPEEHLRRIQHLMQVLHPDRLGQIGVDPSTIAYTSQEIGAVFNAFRDARRGQNQLAPLVRQLYARDRPRFPSRWSPNNAAGQLPASGADPAYRQRAASPPPPPPPPTPQSQRAQPGGGSAEHPIDIDDDSDYEDVADSFASSSSDDLPDDPLQGRPRRDNQHSSPPRPPRNAQFERERRPYGTGPRPQAEPSPPPRPRRQQTRRAANHQAAPLPSMARTSGLSIRDLYRLAGDENRLVIGITYPQGVRRGPYTLVTAGIDNNGSLSYRINARDIDGEPVSLGTRQASSFSFSRITGNGGRLLGIFAASTEADIRRYVTALRNGTIQF